MPARKPFNTPPVNILPVYRIIHVRKEVQTLQLGVTMESPVEELVEEFDSEEDWLRRIEELKTAGFEIHVKDGDAYAVRPGVRRKI